MPDLTQAQNPVSFSKKNHQIASSSIQLRGLGWQQVANPHHDRIAIDCRTFHELVSLRDRHVFAPPVVSKGLPMLYAISDVNFQSTVRPDRTELLSCLIPLCRLRTTWPTRTQGHGMDMPWRLWI